MDAATLDSWAASAGVLFAGDAKSDSHVAAELSSFSPETDIGYRKKLPTNVWNLIAERMKNDVEDEEGFYSGFGSIREDEEAFDTHNVLSALETLSTAWPTMYTHINTNPSPENWRAAYRAGVDDIINYIFPTKSDQAKSVRFDARVRLRAPHPPPEHFNPDIVADILITIVPRSIKLKGGLNQCQYSWQASADHDQVSVSLIGFAVQYERYDSQNRRLGRSLAAILSTAQSQRKALGLEDTIIYGANICSGECRIFASWWSKKSEISFSTTDHFLRLWQPYDLVRWYVFLSKVHIKIKELEAKLEDFEELGGGEAWRAPDRN